jgi:hypothetical protein
MSTLGLLKRPRLASSGTFSALCILAASSLFGCGGSPAKPATAPATAVAPVPNAKEEPPDLSPVAAPAELFAVARFKNPETAIETVSSWANFPFKLQSALPADLRGLGPVVAWNAPLELAVALDPLGEGKVPEPLSVVSIGVTSLNAALEFARAQGEAVHRLRSGVYRIGDSEDVACTVGAAVGSAPARLICGHRTRDVDGLFDYATRGLPNEALPDLDFQIELRLEPVKKKYGTELGSARLFGGFLLREIQMDNPRFDRALSDVAYGLIDETLAFIHDLDKLRLDATIDRQKNQINLRFDAKFTAQQSWLAQAVTETAALSAPAPEAFWQLPIDAADASYGVGWKPGRLKPLGRALGELLDAFLEAEKVPATLRTQGSKALEGMFELNTNAVRADGALAELPADPLLAADYRFFGWQMTELSSEPKLVLSIFDGLVASLGSRDLARILKQRAQIEDKMLPKFSSHGVTVRGFKAGAKAYRVDLPRGLLEKLAEKPALSMQEFAVALAAPAQKGKPAAKSAPLSFVVAWDGEHTFIGVSPDEKAVIKRLEAAKDPKAPSLRSRAGLDALRSTPHVGAGFMTLRRFSNMLGLSGRDADATKLLSALPQHGETPMIFSSDAKAEGPESTLSIAIPRAAIGDIGALVPVLALAAGKNAGSVLATP